MKGTFRHGICGAMILLSLGACAHQKAVDQKVDQEVKAEPSSPPGGRLAADSRRLIEESTSLSAEQKSKLMALHSRMAGEVAAIREQEGKTKMVFFRTLLNPKSSEAEIANLKKKIVDLDRRKTSQMISGLEEARRILGRTDISGDERLYRAFIGEHGGYHEF